jgi:hypothetical protein
MELDGQTRVYVATNDASTVRQVYPATADTPQEGQRAEAVLRRADANCLYRFERKKSHDDNGVHYMTKLTDTDILNVKVAGTRERFDIDCAQHKGEDRYPYIVEQAEQSEQFIGRTTLAGLTIVIYE